jgi:uncharacterized membrane protein
MLIVVMAWLYVIILFAVAQSSAGSAAVILIFLGVCPVVLLAWLLRMRRRQRIRSAQSRGEA